MEKPSRKSLKLAELIRDAIALLIKRGEIKIPEKKRRPLPPSGKHKDKGPTNRTSQADLFRLLEIASELASE